MHRLKQVFVGISLFAMLAADARAEQVVNPLYASWAKHKVGTNATLKMLTNVEGRETRADTRMTLIELTDEKAVIENTITVHLNGQEMKAPPKRTELKKMTERDSKEPGQIDAAKLEKASSESVTVPAGTFNAKMIPVSVERDGAATRGKVWYSDEVPGGTIKVEMKTLGKQAEVKVELAAIEKK